MEESNNTQISLSRSNSRTSSNSEIEKELIYLDISNEKSQANTIKKRISSSRTPTRKAKRVRFYRNGDKFYSGIVIPVSIERYRFVFFYIQFFLKFILIFFFSLDHLTV